MSTAISLEVRELPARRLSAAGIRDARTTRLVVQLLVAPKVYREAWLDTGSSYAVLPEKLWQRLNRTILVPGIAAPFAGGDIPADFAEVSFAITDQKRFTPWLTTRAYCCHSNHVPAFIGMDVIVTRGARLVLDGLRRAAFIEFPF